MLIGGSGERKTLRLVAQYADACNLFGSGADEVAHKIGVLDGHCADLGRDPAEIQKTIIWGSDDALTDPDGFMAEMAAYARLGVDQVWTGARGADPADWVARLCDRVVEPLASF